MCQLDEIMQVFERAVATPAIKIGDEWRTSDRREHRGIAPKSYVALRIAGVDGKFAGALEQSARQSARNAHPLALHVRTCFLPQPQGLRIAAELDADFLQDGLGVGLDDLDRLGAQQVSPV